MVELDDGGNLTYKEAQISIATSIMRKHPWRQIMFHHKRGMGGLGLPSLALKGPFPSGQDVTAVRTQPKGGGKPPEPNSGRCEFISLAGDRFTRRVKVLFGFQPDAPGVHPAAGPGQRA